MNITFDIEIALKLLFTIAGFVIIFVSLKSLFDLRKLEKIGIKTFGRIMDTIQDNTGDETTYFPLIEFQTQEGKNVKVKTDNSGYGPFSIGLIVPIMYNPHKPNKMEINPFTNKYYANTFFLICGILFSCTGLFSSDASISISDWVILIWRQYQQ